MHDVKYIFFFFFICLVMYNSPSVHLLAWRPRSKCPSCYFLALFNVVSVRANGRKTICAVQTSLPLALFHRKRDLLRAEKKN